MRRQDIEAEVYPSSLSQVQVRNPFIIAAFTLLLLGLLIGRRRRLLLLATVFLVLNFTPIGGFGFVAVGLLNGTGEGGAAGIELVAVAGGLGGLEAAEGDGLVAAEALAHVDHAAAAVAETLLQLLALSWQGLGQRGPQTLGGRVPLHHHALALLQALGQCGSWLRRRVGAATGSAVERSHMVKRLLGGYIAFTCPRMLTVWGLSRTYLFA